MKKRSIKKVLALGLAGAMLCGMLTACGGAENSLLFYALYLYQNAFNLFKMGKASAMAWILFVVVAVVTAVVFKTQDRWVSYGEE